MGYTLREAAAEAGCSRSTIHRAIKSGRLSAQRGDHGSYAIDPAELARVFPRDARETSHRDGSEQERAAGHESPEVLLVKVEMLEAQLRREQETIDDLRSRLDRAEERAFALAAPAVPQPPQAHVWSRLRRLLSG
ncbi:helix-turn-helix domain-containing protein [Roseitranquillus sediminis]|uniref:helix-turn-helix domain-containing protein n=1 Tax=Roseitranquillus sediminis TaxID=2809051 RepID=UPI001D0CD274|nr:helix-turn-helix domain-containing protein [Roseitranquillus sediminis]MBM9593993.1 helix-turn-helix domain-containing protein [Roseitranquillus sediminis]